jgi:V-type H+-transporting ATPase subunit a
MDGENYAYNEESAQNEFQPDGENYQLQEQSYDPNGSGQAYSAPITSTASAGSLFRSEEMALCQLFLQSEAAYACVSELGELGLVQFRDLNPDTSAFQRKFVNEVRRCDEMERKLRFLEKEIKKDEIPMTDCSDCPEAPQPREMIDLEATFEKLEHELQEVNQNAEALKKNFLELTELKHILRKTQQFFEEQDQMEGPVGQHQQLISDDGTAQAQGGLQLGFVAGVILRERLPAFERMLWRACRGNVFLRQAEIEDPLEDPNAESKEVFKSVFVIFFQGEQLKSRVKKICEGFRATLYPCPDQAADRREMAVGVMQRLEDLNTVLGQTNDHRHRVLVAAAKNIKIWFVKVRKIKAIYHTLNLFNLDVTQKCLIAECWIPTADIEAIQLALRRGTERSGSTVAPILNQMQTKESPPTFFRTNKYTNAFQALINAYGVAGYREANPAVYTIITFPFLFAVMFGDAGHGCIMLAFGLYMCIKEKMLEARKINSEVWNYFFNGRYLITIMAMFSIYTGLIYNDVFSKSLNIFGSSWQVSPDISEEGILKNYHEKMLNPGLKGHEKNAEWFGTPYPFGVDPVWQISENKIQFLNAFKMKFSIIVGVIHMTFGVLMSYNNAKYFKKPLNIMAEFIPQIIFMMCMFGYLSLLMWHKWTAYSADVDDIRMSERCAPSILITFINMVLFKDNEFEPVCESAYMFAGQKWIQRLLVFLSLLCIPWLLFLKPFMQMREHNQKASARRQNVNGSGGTEGDKDEPFDTAECFILQAIHTIEYVLGSVSHTASYLRLWALSLAHAQLSEVLWMMVLKKGLTIDKWYGGVVLWAIFAFWSVCTVSILCLMEGLSAFLHTLRLHWVEFQSKFYKGDGYIFVPFSFENILKQSEEEGLN